MSANLEKPPMGNRRAFFRKNVPRFYHCLGVESGFDPIFDPRRPLKNRPVGALKGGQMALVMVECDLDRAIAEQSGFYRVAIR